MNDVSTVCPGPPACLHCELCGCQVPASEPVCQGCLRQCKRLQVTVKQAQALKRKGPEGYLFLARFLEVEGYNVDEIKERMSALRKEPEEAEHRLLTGQTDE